VRRLKIVHAAVKAKAKAWIFEAKVIKMWHRGASRSWSWLQNYTTGSKPITHKFYQNEIST